MANANAKFDYDKLKELQGVLSKEAQFVPMDPSMAQGGGAPMPPDAGGAQMPPMDPAAGGAPMDPAMGGMPMDPAMGGMPPEAAPMDPSGLPPPPSEDGAGDVSPDGEPYIKMTMKQLIKLVEQIAQLSTKITSNAAPQAQAQQANASNAGGTDNAAAIAELNAKVDAALQAVYAMNGGGGGGIG